MTDEYFGLALTYPAARIATTAPEALDPDMRRHLHLHKQKLTLIVEKFEAAQETVQSIFTNTLMLADAAATMKAQIKAAQTHSHPEAELAEFDQRQTSLMLEALKRLAFTATNEVLRSFDE
jgi:hypothetical protein